MGKRVLITDYMTWGPPSFHIRMFSTGHLNSPETTLWSFIDVKLELIHPFEIDNTASTATIDFKPILIFAPRHKTISFNTANRAVLESHKRKRRVVHLDWSDLITTWNSALACERL